MYNRLFTKILDSSIWLEPLATRVVWITLLAAMDEDGYCSFACIQNVARRAGVSEEEATKAMACFEAPDENSFDPENEGRRVARVPGGWLVLNAVKYRNLFKRELMREQTRKRVAAHRAKKQHVTQGNDGVTPGNESVTQSDAVSVSVSDATALSHTQRAKRPRGAPKAQFVIPDEVECITKAQEVGLPPSEGTKFFNYYSANGWMVGRNKMKSMPHAMRNWKANYEQRNGTGSHNGGGYSKPPSEMSPAEKRRELVCRRSAEDEAANEAAFQARNAERLARIKARCNPELADGAGINGGSPEPVLL